MLFCCNTEVVHVRWCQYHSPERLLKTEGTGKQLGGGDSLSMVCNYRIYISQELLLWWASIICDVIVVAATRVDDRNWT